METSRQAEICEAVRKVRSALPTKHSTPDDRQEFSALLGRTLNDLQDKYVNFDRFDFLNRVQHS